jgi:SAM-dependent methyltransferase
LAGGRVAHQLGGAAAFVVGDARRLPFPDGTFDVTFSYSVLQHFDKRVAVAALCEMSRVTRLGGTILVQMPNVLGIRQAFNWVRQRVKSDANVFRVRYWTPWELTRTFRETIGPTRSRADGYFSLNPQPSDVDLLPQAYALVVQASEALKTAARHVPALTLLADSLYLEAENGRAYAKSAQARVSAE